MLSLQHRLSQEGRHEGETPENQPSTSEEFKNEDGHDIEEGDDIEQGEEVENIEDVDDVHEHGDETPIGDAGIAEEQSEDAAVSEQLREHVQEEVKGTAIQVRKSQRVIIPNSVLKSPWIDPKQKHKGKRTYDEKDQLYALCITPSTKDEVVEEFVDKNVYFLTRAELLCLKPRAWLGERIMTMVAKTLVVNQLEDGGTITRHIFNVDFMHKMVQSPRIWSLEANETEILPDHIGYNIGDCDFIFGHCLRFDHWFCYVLDMRSMTFYALDSLVNSLTYLRL
ncbi:hypothetical protein K1719_003019 [Acacia pycnantha]|nr:hypothetical protein K1719_003019 [Acacia pycnantha]